MSLVEAVEPRRNLLTAYRLVVALPSSLLWTEISTLVERGRLVPGNLFSYFTILGLTLFGAVLTWILVISTGRKREASRPGPHRPA